MRSESVPAELPLVSLIIPTRNEGRFIADCLDSVLVGEYPLDRLEILVIDAMSTDDTRALIMARETDAVSVRILDDFERSIPRALNSAIREARGDILIRLDAHTTYARDYLRRCVALLLADEGDIVGGVWHVVPRTTGAWGRAVAVVLSEPFGVGNAHYRTQRLTRPTLVDTVPYFACWRTLFDRFGFFDESIGRSEDMVFNSHVREAGGRILLDPQIHSYYHARTEFWAFVQHNVRNGYWATLPMLWTGRNRLRPRHFAPLGFVMALIALAAGTLADARVGLLLAAVLAMYFAVAASVALRAAIRNRAPMQLPLMPLVFIVLHVSYGFGSIAGLGVVAWNLLMGPRPLQAQ